MYTIIHRGLSIFTARVCASELTALTSPLDRADCRGGSQAMAKTAVPDLCKLFFCTIIVNFTPTVFDLISGLSAYVILG